MGIGARVRLRLVSLLPAREGVLGGYRCKSATKVGFIASQYHIQDNPASAAKRRSRVSVCSD